MAFHHVLLTLSEEPSKPRCVLSDLSAGQLEKQFLRPYRKGENILCGNQVIHITSINRVQIIRTEMTSQHELSVIQDRSFKEIQESNRQSDSLVIISPGHGFDAEDIVEAGEDVTSQYIIGPPGHDATRTILKFFRNPWVVGICTSLIVAVLTELRFPGWFARLGEKVGWSSARPQPDAKLRPTPQGHKEQQPNDNQAKPRKGASSEISMTGAATFDPEPGEMRATVDKSTGVVTVKWSGIGKIVELEQYLTKKHEGKWMLRHKSNNNYFTFNGFLGGRFNVVDDRGKYMLLTREQAVSKILPLVIHGLSIECGDQGGCALQVDSSVP